MRLPARGRRSGPDPVRTWRDGQDTPRRPAPRRLLFVVEAGALVVDLTGAAEVARTDGIWAVAAHATLQPGDRPLWATASAFAVRTGGANPLGEADRVASSPADGAPIQNATNVSLRNDGDGPLLVFVPTTGPAGDDATPSVV